MRGYVYSRQVGQTQRLVIDLFRSSLYFGQQEVMPMNITIEPSTHQVMDPHILARRIGLLPFTVDNINHGYQVTIENTTDQPRLVYSRQLDCEGLVCLTPDQVLGSLRPHESLSMTMRFDRGNAAVHARFDMLQKRFEPMEDKTKITLVHPYRNPRDVLISIRDNVRNLIEAIEIHG